MELKALEILKTLKEAKTFTDYGVIFDGNADIKLSEAIAELEALVNQDKLAKLEKVILDYYLGKGYQIGIGGWSFNIVIRTKYKNKKLLVYFKESELDKWNIWLRIDSEQTTKEMFNKAIEWFKIN